MYGGWIFNVNIYTMNNMFPKTIKQMAQDIFIEDI